MVRSLAILLLIDDRQPDDCRLHLCRLADEIAGQELLFPPAAFTEIKQANTSHRVDIGADA